jgi:hypothetical protein
LQRILKWIDAGDVKVGEIIAIGAKGDQAEKVTKITGKNPVSSWDDVSGDWVMKPSRVELKTANTKQVFSTSNPVGIVENETKMGSDGHWFYR